MMTDVRKRWPGPVEGTEPEKTFLGDGNILHLVRDGGWVSVYNYQNQVR